MVTRLEEREVPALYAVGLLSPSGGDVGQSSATFAGGIALNSTLPTQNGKALVEAASPTAAIQAALTNTITATVGTQSANYSAGAGTIGTSTAAQTPFVVTPATTAGQFTLRLEDLATMPGMQSDWDYDDRSWIVTVVPVLDPPPVGGTSPVATVPQPPNRIELPPTVPPVVVGPPVTPLPLPAEPGQTPPPSDPPPTTEPDPNAPVGQVPPKPTAPVPGEPKKEPPVVKPAPAKACFVAGTPLVTPAGVRAIEELRVGDAVISRDEWDVGGEASVQHVEEVFVATGLVYNITFAGWTIGTTAEHPFWVVGKGWTAANELRAGDLLVGHDRQRVAVERVQATGELATVYNLRVSNHHTYFVGRDEWGFSVWAHNACIVIYRYDAPDARPDDARHWSVKVVPETGDPIWTHQDTRDAPPKKGIDKLETWKSWETKAFINAIKTAGEKSIEVQVTTEQGDAALKYVQAKLDEAKAGPKNDTDYDFYKNSCFTYVAKVLDKAEIKTPTSGAEVVVRLEEILKGK